MFSVWPSLNKTFDRPLAGCCPLSALWDIIGLTDYRSAVKRRVASDRKNKMIKCHTSERRAVSVIEPVFHSPLCLYMEASAKYLFFIMAPKMLLGDWIKRGKSQQFCYAALSVWNSFFFLASQDRTISCHVSAHFWHLILVFQAWQFSCQYCSLHSLPAEKLITSHSFHVSNYRNLWHSASISDNVTSSNRRRRHHHPQHHSVIS